MVNKNGLFDAAKMFKLFAIEVKELLVQVSTVHDVATKMKNTLEK